MSSHTSRISPNNNNGKAPRPPPSLLFLRTTSQDAASGRITTRSKSSHDVATIAAAAQLVAHQERYGSDAVPPEDVLAAWLEGNREIFVAARRASRSRDAGGPKDSQLGSKAGGKSSKPQARRDAQEGGDATGFRRHVRKCRRRVSGLRNAVGRLLNRAGSPDDRDEQIQPTTAETKVAHNNSQANALLKASKESAQNPTHQGNQEKEANPASDNTRTVAPQQEVPREHPGAPPAIRIEDRQTAANAVDEPRTPARPSYSSNTTTLAQSEREAAPSPPEQRGQIHSNQVTHQAPIRIEDERARAKIPLLTHQLHRLDHISRSSDTGNSSNQVARHNDIKRQGRNKSGGLLADRDGLQAHIRDAGFLSGELWLDGVSNRAGARVGLRFVARPLKKTTGGRSSKPERGNSLLPRTGREKIYGLDY
ncbi:hypothetical protein F5Y05DRAFT_416252 [Hypoxylon sp. FL0543]|nr:hypothetical protein F5Y05DRAFT_416252 [Hypoxylon sp. FL0543]